MCREFGSKGTCYCTTGVLWGRDGNRTGHINILQRYTHQVSKSGGKQGRKSEHSCLTLCQRTLSWAQPLVLGRGVRKGQRKGTQRAGPMNKSNVRKEEKESGDRARGKGVGAQACKADSPTCRSAFQQRSWPWSL